MYKVKRFFKRKNLVLVSFLAVAGIFSAGAFAFDNYIKDDAVVKEADAAYWGTWKLHLYHTDGTESVLNMYQEGSSDQTMFANAFALANEGFIIQNTNNTLKQK